MDTSEHSSLSTLFEQLGLPADPPSVEQFIASHAPLDDGIALADAPFWNEGQSHFIREGLADDSDWAEIIDELDALLRH